VLLTDGCCDPLYRKAIRTSMGTVLRTPYARVHDWPQYLTALKGEGFTTVALTPREPAFDLSTLAPPEGRIALIVGSEGPGLSDAVESMADMRVRIRMRTDVDSLNLATATGIALHQLATANR
jgi:tRNA G18 (ribose-2'-O)-methylase SpoU